MRFRVFVVVMSLFFSANLFAAEELDDLADKQSHWWSGISFTPGVGLRHLGLDVKRKSDGYQGNISQSLEAKPFFSFSITSPSWNFDEHWGVTLRSFSSVVTLDSQFYSYDTVDPNTGTTQGDRIDVGTSVSGYYSYIVPAINYHTGSSGFGVFNVALGLGYWTSNLSGTIALTPDKHPTEATPKTQVDLSTNDELAYLFLMSYTTPGQWIYEMTVGGPSFSADGYDYKLEEVTLTVGKQFVL